MIARSQFKINAILDGIDETRDNITDEAGSFLVSEIGCDLQTDTDRTCIKPFVLNTLP